MLPPKECDLQSSFKVVTILKTHSRSTHTRTHTPRARQFKRVLVLCSNPASFPCEHDFFLVLPNIPRPAVWVCSDMVLLFAHLVEAQINNRFLLPPGNVCYTGSQVDHLHVLHGQVWNRALLVAYHFDGGTLSSVPKAHLYETTQAYSYIGEYMLEAHNGIHCG